jgi:hypothetical protein
MTPADCFAKLPALLSDDTDLLRRGRWLNVDCRIDIGSEPFHLIFAQGALAAFDQRPDLTAAVDDGRNSLEQTGMLLSARRAL